MSRDQSLVSDLPHLQIVPKNRWPDGSLKFAVISGRADLRGQAPLTVSLIKGASPIAPALTTGDLIASGITASVDCGVYGAVAWGAADWSSPFQSWIGGPQMSSWVYRKPVGSDAHLVAWLEVRLFAGGAVEVLPWIENGYLRVAAPSNRSTTFAFVLGGSQRFSASIDLPNHCRTPLCGQRTVALAGRGPQVTAMHDTAYL
ncbi:MAG: hypothetical protein IPO43_16725 [Rhodoferax sp.]|nr:hypothetical protein [Rhodoferax sp.]